MLTIAIVGFSEALYFAMPEGGGDNDAGDGESSFRSPARGLLSLFAMLLGDFEQADFATGASLVFFVAFNIIGVIVLLNVLIAIVGDSYDKAVARSRHIFLRSRLELAAEYVLVLPKAMLRDAGEGGNAGFARGDMLGLLLSRCESRASGALVVVGGVRHFVGTEYGYGCGGAALLLGAATVFLPVSAGYALARWLARRAGGDAAARALDPERLLATPNLKPDDAEYLGRIGEINRMVVHGNDRLAAQQRRLRADVEGLERKLDLIVDLLRGRGGGD